MTERTGGRSTPARSLPATLAETRDAWHRLAEHVLSPARHAVTGRIGLRPSAGGFGTPPFGDAATIVAVDRSDIVVVTDGAPTRRIPITTIRAAADFVGIRPGAPGDLYPPATPLEPDAPLHVDLEAARVLADWFALGAEALHRFADELARHSDAASGTDEMPSEAQLWPEHFDLAITAGTVNYGFSPGDEHIRVPYAYVGPHDVPTGDEFFTEPFGAGRTIEQVRSADDAVGFLREGHARARRIPEQRRRR